MVDAKKKRVSVATIYAGRQVLLLHPQREENPDRNYRELTATAPYFTDWTRGSFLSKMNARVDDRATLRDVNPVNKTSQ